MGKKNRLFYVIIIEAFFQIIDFVQSNRDRPPLDAYHLWRKWADAKVCCDYGLSMAITYFDGWVKNEMSQLMLPEYGIF